MPPVQTVVVDVWIDHGKRVVNRRLSIGLNAGTETVEAFEARVVTTIDELLGRTPEPTTDWKALAQELLNELSGWSENINVDENVMRHAREAGLKAKW